MISSDRMLLDLEDARLATLPGTPERARMDTAIASLRKLEADRRRKAIRRPTGRHAIREYTHFGERTVSPREQFVQ